ncbi:hypothetical protein V6N13_070084 [Hibiscus sabdariffa]
MATITKFWVGQQSMEEGTAPSISPSVLELIHQGVAFNTSGNSPAEKAILSWAGMGLKMDMAKTKKSCAILAVEDSNPQKNGSGVLIGRSIDDTVHVHWKGAAEMILAMCWSYYDASGAVKDIDDGEKAKLEQMIRGMGMAAGSLGCIGFAHKQVAEEEYDYLKLDGNRFGLMVDPVPVPVGTAVLGLGY